MSGRKRNQALKDQVAKLGEKLATIKNESATFPITDVDTWNSFFTGGVTASGKNVTPAIAMTCSAVFSCVRLISGAVASAPVKIYKRDGDKTSPASGHKLARLLALRPNEYMTASTFWKTLAAQKVLNGDGYAAILRKRSGDVEALIPLLKLKVTPYHAYELGLDRKLGVDRFRLYYQISWDDGTVSLMDQDDMLHVPNIGWNGKTGLSTIQAGAQAMGLSLSSEESAAALFKNGMMSQVSLQYPTKLDSDALGRLRDHLDRRYSGSVNHHKPLILTEGGEAKTLSLSAGDAQLIETRQFSVIDIARFFGVPPVMIGESSKNSSWGSGVEQMARWFTMFTLNDHLTDIEQEMEVKLFRGDSHYAGFDESELTRGDTKTRGEFYRTARGSMQEPGFMTINEIRSAEGLPPIEGGEELQRPVPGAEKGAKGDA
ncbi:MAG: phage portal protein [Pseudodesulfovibrio sp.]|nr:phage portal protein [Pseudodesulfovibrio sp.]